MIIGQYSRQPYSRGYPHYSFFKWQTLRYLIDGNSEYSFIEYQTVRGINKLIKTFYQTSREVILFLVPTNLYGTLKTVSDGVKGRLKRK